MVGRKHVTVAGGEKRVKPYRRFGLFLGVTSSAPELYSCSGMWTSHAQSREAGGEGRADGTFGPPLGGQELKAFLKVVRCGASAVSWLLPSCGQFCPCIF